MNIYPNEKISLVPPKEQLSPVICYSRKKNLSSNDQFLRRNAPRKCKINTY